MELDLSRFIELVSEISGENFSKCYQCGRCTAGCPLAEHMDATPSVVLRMLQLEDAEVMNIKSPWTCASCVVCTARCPRKVDIAGIMEALRQVKQRYLPEEIELKPLMKDDMPQIAMIAAYRIFERW